MFEEILAQEHKHHNGLKEDVYHHHSETLTKQDIADLVEAMENEEKLDPQTKLNLQRKLETQNKWEKLKQRIFFKSRKELESPDVWQALRREQK
ncbi:unnamed protein product [Diamesa serratosioi]